MSALPPPDDGERRLVARLAIFALLAGIYLVWWLTWALHLVV